ncbi:hypothetical protein ACJ73_07826 [Blastomyces percursus]|uniref:Chromo domain-containing protein n=1 Tax=Blastomyces percursus TaxID=1658174 RepID=A0A1J9QZU1_9EURO|nr:hypothetical protein ACJ73_07826 [Blastomyces percursus]
MAGDTDVKKSFEVEKIISTRVIHRGRDRKPVRQFLLRWKGYAPKDDIWTDEDDCENSKDMIDEFLQTLPAPAPKRRGRSPKK